MRKTLFETIFFKFKHLVLASFVTFRLQVCVLLINPLHFRSLMKYKKLISLTCTNLFTGAYVYAFPPLPNMRTNNVLYIPLKKVTSFSESQSFLQCQIRALQ